MTSLRIYTAGRDNWRGSTPMTDAERNRRHGPIEPMEKPSWLARLMGRG